jgi:hypothetical protein
MTAPGMSMPEQLSAYAGRISDDIGFRSGIVRQYDGINVYVDVSGQTTSSTVSSQQGLQAAAYIESYRPTLGDVVFIAKQGAKWVVLGRFNSVSSNNVIVNPSFEVDSVGTSPPTGWNNYHDPSSPLTTTVSVASSAFGQPIDGLQCCSVSPNSGAAGVKQAFDYVYSTAFSVLPGQRWTASAWARCSQGVSLSFAYGLVQVAIELVWQANITDVPPTAVSGSGYTLTQLSQGPEWTRIPISSFMNGVTVPNGVTAGRLILVSSQYNNSTTSTTSVVQWDKCVARLVA